ncbi:MAG: PAS domain S-box protein, partial [Solirubrobacterales bacterium]|nr:PAS domain S-box protein [Solirubrobacterales bacterium]
MTSSASCEAVLIDAERLLSYVVESTDEAIITTSRDGLITSWNRGAEHLYGYTAGEAIGQHVAILDLSSGAVQEQKLLRRVFAGISIERFDTEKLRKDGEEIVVSEAMTPVKDDRDRVVAAAVIARDVTERRHYEERLRYLADYDQLTGLCNRRRFEEEIKRELARAGRYCNPGAVLSIDLDNFKSINDFAGHAAGDAVLTAVARV